MNKKLKKIEHVDESGIKSKIYWCDGCGSGNDDPIPYHTADCPDHPYLEKPRKDDKSR